MSFLQSIFAKTVIANDKFNITGRGIVFTMKLPQKEISYLCDCINTEKVVKVKFEDNTHLVNVRGIERMRRMHIPEEEDIGLLVKIL